MAAYDAPVKSNPGGWLHTAILLGILIVVGLGILWFHFEQPIKSTTLWLANVMRVVQLPFTFVMPDYYRDVLYNLPNLYEELVGTDYPTEYLTIFGSIVLRSLAIILFILFLPRGIYLVLNHEKIMFTRILTLEKMIAIQRENYPRIKPATARYLLDVDARFGNWASALNPIELVAHRGLIQLTPMETVDDNLLEFHNDRLSNLQSAGLPDPNQVCKELAQLSYIDYASHHFITAKVQSYSSEFEKVLDNIGYYSRTLTVNVEGIREYYRASLGPFCQYEGTYISFGQLPPCERSIWIICLACLSKNPDVRPAIESLLDQLSDSFVEDPTGDSHTIDLSGVDELYSMVKNDTDVKIALRKISAAHAYYYTAFTALYTAAEKSYGVINTSYFLWLKVTNRLLFFALNQVGLEVARPEAAGIRAHYLAEKKRRNGLGLRIYTAQVESATINLCHSLAEDGWLTKPLTKKNENPEHADFMKVTWINDPIQESDTNED